MRTIELERLDHIAIEVMKKLLDGINADVDVRKAYLDCSNEAKVTFADYVAQESYDLARAMIKESRR